MAEKSETTSSTLYDKTSGHGVNCFSDTHLDKVIRKMDVDGECLRLASWENKIIKNNLFLQGLFARLCISWLTILRNPIQC